MLAQCRHALNPTVAVGNVWGTMTNVIPVQQDLFVHLTLLEIAARPHRVCTAVQLVVVAVVVVVLQQGARHLHLGNAVAIATLLRQVVIMHALNALKLVQLNFKFLKL